ncbi:phosphotransacetylase [Ferviditalea candida]|uniref:Phosphotransacetylase n=1 Tax=Ferviditalea candida TaxID=3108399 RepID=A0ABU5ZIN3_9BACL|nr:phosphotransacetylase [Paenibacillaceae bacterium T2]
MQTKLEDVRMRAFQATCRIVLVDGGDERVLQASAFVQRTSAIQPVLLGNRELISNHIRSLGLPIQPEIIDPQESGLVDRFVPVYQEKMRSKGKAVPEYESAAERLKNPSYFGAVLLEAGIVDGMLGGASLPTAEILRASLEVVGMAEDAQIISGSFCMFLPAALPSGNDVLVFSDCAVVPDPDAGQLAAIAMNAVKVAKKVAGLDPVVAFLSFSTKGSAKHPKLDKVIAAKELLSRQLPDAAIDGELQADAAIIPEISARKAPQSAAGGRANILIFPDLNSGNISYKLVERLANVKALGVILEGFRKPVNDLSRGCSVDDVIDMMCVTALQTARFEKQ